jgi:tetratricopeptide (TPR) repeat protein
MAVDLAMTCRTRATWVIAAALLIFAVIPAARTLGDNPTGPADLLAPASVAYDVCDWDSTIQLASSVLKTDPNRSEAWRLRGCAYGRKGDGDNALKDLGEALRIDPKDAQAYACHGLVFSNRGIPDEALADYTEAVRLPPRNADFYSQRGDFYFEQHEYDRAVADYTTAIKLNPSASRFYDSRGLNYWWEEKYSLALADFDTALRVDPANASARARRKGLRERMLGENWGAYARAYYGMPRWLIRLQSSVAILILLVLPVLLYRSRAMFGRRVDRCFVRTPEGLLVFYPRTAGTGYVVPDPTREAALRKFIKRLQLSSFFVTPILVSFAFWLGLRLRQPPILGSVLVVLVFYAVLWIVVRKATEGLDRSPEKRRWRDVLRVGFRDLSPGMQWLGVVVWALLFMQSLIMVWFVRGWAGRAVNFSNMFLFGFLLWSYLSVLRERNPEAQEPGRP